MSIETNTVPTSELTESPRVEPTSLAEFLSGVLTRTPALPALHLALLDAVGSVLATDLHAPCSLPATDTAAVDGYAVRAEEFRAAASAGPVTIPVIGDISIGAWQLARLPAGGCFFVTKGAQIPPGADTLIPQEWSDHGVVNVCVEAIPRTGHGVIREGDVSRVGTLLAEAGTPLTPELIGVLAAHGCDHVQAMPKPRLITVAAGNSIVEPSQLGAGYTADSGTYVVAAGARHCGAQAFRIAALGDDPKRVRSTIEDNAMRADVVVAVGDQQLVAEVCEGVEVTPLPVSPGRGLAFGFVGEDQDTPLFVLPHDPVAALVWFELAVRPVLRRLVGHREVFCRSMKATLHAPVTSIEGVREFFPATVSERRGGGHTVTARSGGIHDVVGADALLVISAQAGHVSAGTTVDVMLLDR